MRTCFVIGPIGDKFAPHGSQDRQRYEDALDVLEKVIEPACQAQELDAVRVDQIAASGDINEQVFRHLRDDDVVIADVSGGNANVMYELGVRHTTGKVTIQIGEYGQLPFDIQTIRTIQFSRSKRGLVDARIELEQALAAAILEGAELLPVTRIWRADIKSEHAESDDTPDVGTTIGEPVSEGDGGDLSPLDSLEVVEEAIPDLNDIATEIGATMESIGALSVDASEEVERVSAQNPTASARLAALSRFAQRLEEPTSQLEDLSIRYEKHLEVIDSAVHSIIRQFETNDDELQDERVQEFIREVSGLATASREAMEGVNSFAASASGMGAISKRLRVPGRRLAEATKRIARATEKIDEWERRLAPMLKSDA